MYREAQDELIERVKQAAALPVVISIRDVYDETCTELLVLANLDSGARGRPRVTYDVTAALNAMQLCVFMADVYIESAGGGGEQRPQELHRFLVHCIDGCRLRSAAEKRWFLSCPIVVPLPCYIQITCGDWCFVFLLLCHVWVAEV